VSGESSVFPAWTRWVPRLACLMAGLAFTIHAYLWVPRLTYGFAMYYTYARLALEGDSLDRVYDDVYFNAKVHEFGFDLNDEPNNAPTAALAYLPVAWMQPVWARIVWSLVSISALVYALKILFEISGIRPAGNTGLWLLTLMLVWKPSYDNVAFGQVYFVLLLLFALAMRGFMRWHVAGTALPLALTVLLKGYGGVPLILMALRRRWKESFLVLSLILIVIIATLPLLGMHSWTAFVVNVLPSLGAMPSHGHVAYQTINGLLRHLFTFDAHWLPHPAVVLPGAAVAIVSYAASIALILFVLMRSRLETPPERLLSLSAALAAGVVTAPLAEEYHFVLFIPLIFALAARFHEQGPSGLWKESGSVVAAIAVLLLASPLSYKALQYSTFPLVLLAYPKLYAGLAILWYARAVMGRRESDRHGASL